MNIQQQLEFEYDCEEHILPEEIRERIKADGADSVSTSDLATLLFESRAVEAIDALQAMASGNGDVRSIPTGSVQTMAALELLRRIFTNRSCRSPKDVYRLVQHYAYESPYQEVFGVVTLNGAHEVIRPVLITRGLLNRTLIAPRECFLPAIEDHAAAVIAFHLHPSGNTEPSSDDLDVTYRLRRAGQVLGIELLDHIIIAKDGYHSMSENGELSY